MRKLFLTLTFLSIVILHVSAYSATYYVDWDLGTDQANCGQSDGEGACATPWYSGLTSQLGNGHTVIIHEKDDSSPYSRGCAGGESIDATTAGVAWRAAAGEEVWLSRTGDKTSNPYSTCGISPNEGGQAVAISAANVTIDGFYVWGNIRAGGDNGTIQNCDLSGGCDFQGFPAVIRTGCDGLTIKNCKIHDNVSAQSQGPTNDMAVLTYDSSGVVVENCEFYDVLRMGIRWKDECSQHIARYNFFHNLAVGIAGDAQYGADWVYTYQNIFSNVTTQAIAVENGAGTGNTFRVYNNTFYNCAVDMGYWYNGGDSAEYFNNLFYHSSSSQYYHKYDQDWDMSDWDYNNYNHYYSSGVTTYWRINDTNRASTLSAWKTWLDGEGAGSDNGDDNSVEKNPNFVQVGGVMGDEPEDFKRSSYPTDGRGGSYSTVMGAYLTGSETIGLISGYATLTGTLADGATEAQIVSGGETLIITITNNEWVATVGADNAITTALINNIDSGGSEGAGWDAIVKANMTYGDVTRDSATQVTVLLGAEATYAITQNETITATIPATALVGGRQVVATPTCEITATPVPSAAVTGGAGDGATEAEIVIGSETVIITLTNDTWVETIGADNQFTTDLIAAIDSGGSEAAGWDVQMKGTLAHGDITRTSDTVLTIVLPAVAGYSITTNETITVSIPANNLTGAGIIVASPTFEITAINPSAALTGTLSDGAGEAAIVTGAETLIITLTNDTWHADMGTDVQVTKDLIAGIDSNKEEATGWDAEVKGDGTNHLTYADITRTNATVVTIELDAEASYAITDDETITVTVPAAALVTSSAAIVATPTFQITAANPAAVLTGTLSDGATEAQIVTGGETLIITLSDDTWVATVGDDGTPTDNLILGITSAQSETLGWENVVKANMVFGDITRDTDTQVTVLLGAEATYDVSANETITVTIPVDAVTSGTQIVATPSINIVFFDTSTEEIAGMTLQ